MGKGILFNGSLYSQQLSSNRPPKIKFDMQRTTNKRVYMVSSAGNWSTGGSGTTSTTGHDLIEYLIDIENFGTYYMASTEGGKLGAIVMGANTGYFYQSEIMRKISDNGTGNMPIYMGMEAGINAAPILGTYISQLIPGVTDMVPFSLRNRDINTSAALHTPSTIMFWCFYRPGAVEFKRPELVNTIDFQQGLWLNGDTYGGSLKDIDPIYWMPKSKRINTSQSINAGSVLGTRTCNIWWQLMENCFLKYISWMTKPSSSFSSWTSSSSSNVTILYDLPNNARFENVDVPLVGTLTDAIAAKHFSVVGFCNSGPTRIRGQRPIGIGEGTNTQINMPMSFAGQTGGTASLQRCHMMGPSSLLLKIRGAPNFFTLGDDFPPLFGGTL